MALDLTGKILVVEDDKSLRAALLRVLKRDYKVTAVGTPEEAVQLATGFLPDISIVDVRLGTESGLELMTRIAKDVPAISFIVVTGFPGEAGQILAALREHAFYYIEKPFDLEELLTLVRLCLTQRALRQEFEVAQKYREETEAPGCCSTGSFPRRVGATAARGSSAYRGRCSTSGATSTITLASAMVKELPSSWRTSRDTASRRRC